MERAKVGIVVKPKNPRAQRLARDVASFLHAHKIGFYVDNEGSSALSADLIQRSQIIPRREIIQRTDLAVILGGDGTFISAARYPCPNPAKILGVNVGTLGFLTEITARELTTVLEKALQGDVTTERRTLLEAKLRTSTGQQRTFHALNDVVIAKGALARIFGVDLYIDHSLAAAMRGDGVIISSPSGSTAYSLAAGGSIVHPLVNALLMTPICPHSLTARPLIVPGASRIKLKMHPGRKEGGDEVYLTVDGQEGLQIGADDEVEVTTSDFSIELVTSPSRGYFEMLSTKLKWAATANTTRRA